MTRTAAMIVALVVLVGSMLGCCVLPQMPQITIPEIKIKVPTMVVGELRDEQQTVPLGGLSSAEVDIVFGAGKFSLAGGAGDLMSGRFVYNVENWQPEVKLEGNRLKVQQGGDEQEWGIPSGEAGSLRNEWELAFSSAVPLTFDIRIGASDGTLDFSGLRVEALDLDLGAGNLELRFGEQNAEQMDHLTVDAGATRLVVTGLGYAGPDRVKVQGGAGDIDLDFSGKWSHSAEVDVISGVSKVTLRLPKDVGVRVEAKGGIASLSAPGFKKVGNVYTNAAFGQAETELRIEVTAGVGSVELIEISQ